MNSKAALKNLIKALPTFSCPKPIQYKTDHLLSVPQSAHKYFTNQFISKFVIPHSESGHRAHYKTL